jgi:hypothetical protein
VRLSRMLLDGEEERVPSSLRAAARFLSTTTAEEFLEDALSDPAPVREVLTHVSGLDHVGFMATAQSDGVIASAAEAAGFDAEQRTFPSTILARQLGELAGGEMVPTTIFKAWGKSSDGLPVAVEVAMAREIDQEVVRGWIRRGIGAHAALRITAPSHFADIRHAMEAGGFRSPGFMNEKPLTNAAEGITAMFFDRRPSQPLGVEFCHYH